MNVIARLRRYFSDKRRAMEQSVTTDPREREMVMRAQQEQEERLRYIQDMIDVKLRSSDAKGTGPY